MADFATFNPIISETKDEMLNYHRENNLPLPDNKHFKEYFQITDYTQTDNTIPQASTPAGKYFNNTTVKKKLPIGPPTSAAEKPKVPYRAFGDYKIKIGAKDSIASRNNNPGNLMYASQPSAIKGEARGKGYWAKFETPEAGFAALMRQVDLDKSPERDHTIQSFLEKYAPPTENNTSSYIAKLEKQFGVSADTKLASLNTFQIAKFIAGRESSTKVI